MNILKLMPVLLMILLGSCEKEVVAPYNGGDRVQFKTTSSNAAVRYNERLAYSFAGKGAISEHTMQIPIHIVGNTADQDRQVAVKVDPEKTNAKEGVDFKLGECFIPAGMSQGFVNLTLLKTAALETEVKTVSLRLVENEAFKPGVVAQLSSTISFYNSLVKPVDWDTYMFRYLGAYSKRKHEFILFYLDIAEINYAPAGKEDKENNLYGGTSLLYFQIRLRSLLNDLNNGIVAPKENDPFTYPLMDAETGGNRIVFP